MSYLKVFFMGEVMASLPVPFVAWPHAMLAAAV
jgi:hypothetical protein